MSDFEARRSAFSRWRCAPLGELLGSGRYASVYACGEGAAAKVVDLSGKSRRSRMQAYREHVVSIMQTLLLLQCVTPPFPFHYGLTVAVAKPGLSLTLFMERFSGNLLESAGALRDVPSWVHLAFQVLHACLCLSTLFGVVHNDLYPRNVLVRRTDLEVSAAVEGVCYGFRPRYLAVVADYGIASGRLVAANAPEVCLSTTKVPRWPHFAGQPPSAHVLQYEPMLPASSRDPYTVLKWVVYGQEALPTAPLAVRRWAMDGLRRMDASLESFHADEAQLPLFHHLFHADNLRRFGLPSVAAACARPTCMLRLKDKPELMRRATEALQHLGSDERDWASALKRYREENASVNASTQSSKVSTPAEQLHGESAHGGQPPTDHREETE
jgi:hypothetical protein